MHRAETVKRAAAIKRGQVTQAEKRRDRVILYSALVALRWLLYAGCSTLFFVITLVLLCFGSTLFWLYGACSLRFPYLRHEPPQNLHQISTYRISTASLPFLCRISAESLPNLHSQRFACLYSVSLRCSLGCGPCRAACASLCHCCLSCLSCNVGFLGSHARISHVAECFP
jgi:hypothetical protein